MARGNVHFERLFLERTMVITHQSSLVYEQPPSLSEKGRLESCTPKVVLFVGCISANTRPYQPWWGDQEMGTATACSQVAGLIHMGGNS